MKVILREAVPTLGKAGDIKEVRMGYGFNFLLPRGLAELATTSNIKRILAWVGKEAKKRLKEVATLEDTVEKLDGKKITIKMKSKDGKLFGSVGKTLMVEAFKEKGVDLLDDAIILDHPLKKVGEHLVKVKAGKAESTFKVVIVAE